MHILRIIALTMVMVGAIVLGILGIFNFNLLSALFGEASVLTRIVYALIGISAVVLLATQSYDECYCDCNCDDGSY
jgi:uncharacterized membrane protein YuzA (DUF378 family)